jgi:hypothetical protein
MAFCTQCGKKLDDGLKFCINCGSKIDLLPMQDSNLKQPIRPITSQYKPEPSPQYFDHKSEIVIRHAAEKGHDVSTGFGRAFGETTGTAVGCFVIVGVIVAVLVLIAIFSFM